MATLHLFGLCVAGTFLVMLAATDENVQFPIRQAVRWLRERIA